ncbi:MAG: glycosyltransferase family 4 protein [Beijerinckiaceae bacterium]|nr:glycosyltransferase family 4 protein [Beijerinckiaceae bacterium]
MIPAMLPRNPIRVAVYSGELRPFVPMTGSDKHIENMLAGMARQADFEVKFYVPHEKWVEDEGAPHSEASAIASVRLPVTRRRMLLTSLTRYGAPFETYAPDADWVYAPRELLCSTRTAKFAVTIHDIYNFEPERRRLFSPRQTFHFYRWAEAISQAKVVLTVSQFTKHRLCDVFGASSEKIVVVGNGITPAYFDIASMEPAAVTPLPGAPYYISVGGITSKKGGHRLLSFARSLETASPDQRLVVIGIVESEFEAEITTRRNLIVVPHGLADSEVARWVRGATAMLCFSEYEGFGITAAEAMAAEVPVIAHRQGALVEVVGDAGLIIDADSQTQLSDAQSIAHDLTLRAQLIERGRARADRFRWERCAETLVHALRQN